MKQDLEHLRGGPFLHCLQKVSELETLPVTILKQIQQQIRVDLETIEKVSPPKLPGCFSVSLRDARTVGAEQNSCGFGGRMIHSTNMPTWQKMVRFTPGTLKQRYWRSEHVTNHWEKRHCVLKNFFRCVSLKFLVATLTPEKTFFQTIYQHTAMKCMVCRERNRSVAVLPCNHYVLCEVCANKKTDCPFCHAQIQQRTPVVLPM